MTQDAYNAIKQLNERMGFLAHEEEVQLASAACHLLELPKRRTLFHAGESPHYFYRVFKGCVQLHTAHAEGTDRQILTFVRDGGSVGHAAAFLGEPYPMSAETVCETRVIACPRAFVMQLLADKPHMALNMLRSMSLQSLAATQRMSELLVKSALARVACHLLEHAPSLQSNTYELALSASKQTIAAYLQLSQETFSRILADLKRAGIIAVQGRIINVLDREQLTLLKSGMDLGALPPPPRLG